MGNRKNLPQHGTSDPTRNLMIAAFTEKKLRGPASPFVNTPGHYSFWGILIVGPMICDY